MFKEAKVQEESVLGMGCLAAILHIALFFVTGTISYNLVEPQSFLGVLLFLIVWLIVHTIGKYVLEFLLAAMFVVLDRK